MTLLRKRAADRAPVSRLIGQREFWGLPFELSPATLDPRPDSETLVEAVLRPYKPAHDAAFCIRPRRRHRLPAVVHPERTPGGERGGLRHRPGRGRNRTEQRSLAGPVGACPACRRRRVRRLRRSVRLDRLQPALHSGGGDRRPGTGGPGPRSARCPGRRSRRSGCVSPLCARHRRAAGAGGESRRGVRRRTGPPRYRTFSLPPASTMWKSLPTWPAGRALLWHSRGEIALARPPRLCYEGLAFAATDTRKSGFRE